MKYSLLLLTLLISSFSFASVSNFLDLETHKKIIHELKQPISAPGKVRMLSDSPIELPDPTRPLEIILPNEDKKVVLGFSGQQILLLDNFESLILGGVKTASKVNLQNALGFNYGGEINSQTGLPIGYQEDSSTWDVALFWFKDPLGMLKLKVLAGAMGDDEDGRPYLIREGFNNTRQRVFFDAEFRGDKLFAYNPQTPLNRGKPVDGNWIQKDDQGEIIFNHGYGGEPLTFPNGDLFIDEHDRVPFIHEIVVEQKEEIDGSGVLRKIPYRTAIVVTYLDQNLKQALGPSEILLDVYKEDGSIWSAAQRPLAGPLVEGPHLEIHSGGKLVQSLDEFRRLKRDKKKLTYQMLFSAGEYFGHYGSYLAYSENSLHNFKPVTQNDELYDITAPLRVLFTWIGRPVSFHAGGKEYLLIHGVDRSGLPPGIILDEIPKPHEWKYFSRQLIVVPVERDSNNKLIIKDDSGLIEFLKKFTPRKVS